MEDKVTCATCTRVVCGSEHYLDGPDNCPTKTKAETIEKAVREYEKPDIKEFARQSSIQESECYQNMPEGSVTRHPRVEETVQFAKKMGYRKLGIAFCVGLKDEAEMLNRILENRGFDVVSVCCKAGGIPKETIGIKEEEKIVTKFSGPGHWESMCSPITQAEILNDAEVDFNILVGLCVGHDSLFIKYATAPITVLVAKDRVFGHNPVAGLYQARAYYRRLLRKEPIDQRL